MKIILRLFVFSILFVGYPALAAISYQISAAEIYNQAKRNNVSYFNLLRRYPGAVDVVGKDGNTAYCLAVQQQDYQTVQFLIANGANRGQRCLRRDIQEQRHYKSSNGSFLTNIDKKEYVYAGAGVLALGAGVALALSGSGGSGGHGAVSNGNSGSRDDEYTPPVGNGNSGSGDDEYTPPPVTTPSGSLYDMTAKEFETAEYHRGNFLDGINASKAYSYMFKKDEEGNIFGHQAQSDEALKKVKVGVIDTGVYANKDLVGKLGGSYDYNKFNSENTIFGVISNAGDHGYVIKQGDSYYLFHLHKNDNGEYGLEIWKKSNDSFAFSEKEMRSALLAGWGVSFDSLSPMNGLGGGGPGVNTKNNYSPTDENFWLAWASAAIDMSHGTHIAGIIGANKNNSGMHGVAFDNAEIVSGSWDLAQSQYNMVKSMVDNGVTVLNNSWGYDAHSYTAADAEYLKSNDPNTLASYAYAAKNGAVWVQATGNDGVENAAMHTGMGNLNLSEYGYEGPGKYEAPFLAVTALDYDTRDASAPSGKLSDYANWCGSAKGYCLAAPGNNIESTAGMASGNMVMSGTSMATPVVSGSVALLSGYYPWLSAQNIAYLLLETANNRGEYANSDMYGRGALDLEAAVTTPIGGLNLPSSTSFASVTPAGLSRLSLSSAVQNKLRQALPQNITAFDGLQRPFDYNTENMVNNVHASSAQLKNTVSRMAVAAPKKTVKNEKSGFSFTSASLLNDGGREQYGFAEVSHATASGESRLYYAKNSKYDASEEVLLPSSNPYLAMNEAYGAENTLKLSPSSKFKLTLQTGENGLYERDKEQDSRSFRERSYALGGEYSYGLTDYLEASVLGGMLFEDEAMLGMNGSGGFAFQSGTTYYTGIKGALQLTDNFALLAAYYMGYTQGADTAMLSVSDIVTESFMLAGEYKLNKSDKVGLSLASPMSVRKGKASFMYATGRDNYSNTIYMDKATASLAPEAREYDVGLYYKGEPKEGLSFSAKAEARLNADGEKGVTDYIGMAGVSAAF